MITTVGVQCFVDLKLMIMGLRYHLCAISVLVAAVPARVCPNPCFLVKVAPFDEIVANPSDLKHVVELLRCSNGLGVVIAVGLRHLCVFYCGFQTPLSDFGRRLVAVADTARRN